MNTLYDLDNLENLNTPEQNRELQKELSLKWKEYDEEFRISAVIHDGQWYTKDKWKRVAKVKTIEDLEFWIEKNRNILIAHENGVSFRVDKNEIIRWYQEHNLDITKELVPKNYPPRIWNNKTETETFLDTPKELVSNLLVKSNDKKLKQKIISILQPFSQIKEDEQNRLYFFTMNAEFLKQKLEKILTDEEMSKVDFRVRQAFLRRELTDFDEVFLENLMQFYYVLSITLLKSHQNTMRIFLPDKFDRAAQVYEWIIKALQKFDEEAGVPFSGYLASVLNRWPYDLPDNTLGKSMADYQRKRAKAVKKLTELHGEVNVPLLLLREELSSYSDSQFNEFEKWHNHWLKMQGASNLTWEDKNAEKVGENLTSEQSYIDYSLRSKITIAILNACVNTNNQLICVRLLSDMYNLTDLSKIDYISNKLKEEIRKELSKRLNGKT